MKVNYRTHPSLQLLSTGELGVLPIYESDKEYFSSIELNRYKYYWDKYLEYFRYETVVISNAFYQASLGASVKLLELYKDIASSNIVDYEVNGVYIVGDRVIMIRHLMMKDKEDCDICMFGFNKQGVPQYLYVDTKDGVYGWVSRAYDLPATLNNKEVTDFIYNEIASYIVLSMFKSYAEVETKYLLPGQRAKDINCKYINETKLPLTYLDSKWFTNLIKSDAFKVRGHFRLQPKKKDGQWTRELIWINDFMKSGYTAPARKLQEA